MGLLEGPTVGLTLYSWLVPLAEARHRSKDVFTLILWFAHSASPGPRRPLGTSKPTCFGTVGDDGCRSSVSEIVRPRPRSLRAPANPRLDLAPHMQGYTGEVVCTRTRFVPATGPRSRLLRVTRPRCGWAVLVLMEGIWGGWKASEPPARLGMAAPLASRAAGSEFGSAVAGAWC